MKKIVITAIACVILGGIGARCAAQNIVDPDETYLFAERDSFELYLDIYYPSDGSEMTVDGVNKPTILYIFGGGFKGGRRDSYGTRRWFKMLADEGFTIVAIDYRLGLKNATKMGIGQAKLLYEAIRMAVEDTFSATNFLIENADELDINPGNIVVSGSSAGAITALQAEWEICNRSELASVLPEDFNYAGVMSFAGAIYSKQGSVRYKTAPAPTLMLHGTSDNIVPYKQIRLFNQAFQGTGKISKEYIRKGYDYNIYRFDGYSHEIAGAMLNTVPEQLRWLNTNVIGKERRTVDALVTDPSIVKFNLKDVKDIYNGSVNLE